MPKIYAQFSPLFPEQKKCFQHDKAKKVVKDLVKVKKNGKVAIKFLQHVVEKEQALTDQTLKKLIEKTITKLSSIKLHENKDNFKKVKLLYKQKLEALQQKQQQAQPKPAQVPQQPQQIAPVIIPKAQEPVRVVRQSPVEERRVLKNRALANMSPFFRTVLNDVAQLRLQLRRHAAEEVSKTLNALAILSTLDPDLQKVHDKRFGEILYEVTGIINHAEDDPENRKLFFTNVAATIESLQNIYAKNLTSNEKLRFFRELARGVCFEDRSRVIDTYHSLPNLLSYELDEYKKNQPLNFSPVKINDFINWLQRRNFFERHRITQDAMLKSPTIRNMIALNKLIKENESELPPIAHKLRDTLITEAAIMHKGLEAFKKFVLENVELSTDERENINRYIQLYIVEEDLYADLIKVR